MRKDSSPLCPPPLSVCVCSYSWRRFGACTAPCSTPVSTSSALVYPPRYRPVLCLYQSTKLLADSFCDDLLIPRPVNYALCPLPSCGTYVYRIGAWSPCNTTCGYGVRQRSVECLDFYGE